MTQCPGTFPPAGHHALLRSLSYIFSLHPATQCVKASGNMPKHLSHCVGVEGSSTCHWVCTLEGRSRTQKSLPGLKGRLSGKKVRNTKGLVLKGDR